MGRGQAERDPSGAPAAERRRDGGAGLVAAGARRAAGIDTQAVLIERSGGNPLFAEEFIQLLVDRGLIDLESRDRPVAELHDIPVPDRCKR